MLAVPNRQHFFGLYAPPMGALRTPRAMYEKQAPVTLRRASSEDLVAEAAPGADVVF